MYPYPWGPPPMYPTPPQMPYGPPSPTDIERGMMIAMKLKNKADRKEEKKKEAEAKKKADDKKKAEDNKGKTLFGIEWYILGILSYPIVGPLYRLLTNNLEVLQHIPGVK